MRRLTCLVIVISGVSMASASPQEEVVGFQHPLESFQCSQDC